MTKTLFKGIQQVTMKTFNATSDKKGYLWFVREPQGENTGLGDDKFYIYFGTRCYGSFWEGEHEALAASLEAVKNAIGLGDDFLFAWEGATTVVEAFNKVKGWYDALAQRVSIVESDIVALEEAVATIDTKVATDVYEAKIGELEAAIDTKVDAVDGSRLMSETEGAKLAGIAEGAQVNKIEVVKVNGVALTIADADKSVDVIVPTAPVQGVADDDKILSLDGDKLKSTLTLAYVPATDSEKAALRLQGINGEVVSSIDATAFVKDGMLSGVKLEEPKEGETGEKYLVLSFNTDAGKEDIRMDVTDLLDYYVAGEGLNLDGKTFSVKVDETANKYLQVTTNGIAVSQAFLDKITEFDDEVLAAAKAYADGLASNYDAAGSADAVKNYADETFVTKEGFNEFEAEYEEKLNGIAEGAQVNKIEVVKVNGVEATVTDKVATVTVDGTKVLVGANIEGDVKDAEGNVTKETIYAANTSLAAVLQGIQDSVSVAVSGGLTSVVGGNGIEVSSVVANKQTVSVKVSNAEGNMITADENGIYAAMYYDGDDAE